MNQLSRYFNHPLLKLPLLTGLAAGLLAFGYFLALYAIGRPPLSNARTLDYGIFIIIMATTVWYYRKNYGHGMLHLWEALTICYVMNTIGALVVGWLIYGFITWVDPSVFTDYLANIRQFLLSDKAHFVKELSEQAFIAELQKTAQTKPGDLITDEVAKKTVLAVLPALIISLLFRKQDYSVLN